MSMRRVLPNITLVMTTPTSNARPSGNQRYLSIEVRDEDSGSLIIEIDIEPEQMINFLGNAQTKATAEILPEHVYHRVGKYLVVETRQIEPLDGEPLSYGSQPEHPAVLAAKAQAKTDGWETIQYRFTRGRRDSHQLTLRKWVTEKPEGWDERYDL